MSDIPRKLFAVQIEGETITPSALCTLCLLWSYVSGDDKKAGGPHFVFHTPKRLAKERDVGDRAINMGLQKLRAGGLVESGTHEGAAGYWLRTPKGCEDKNQAPDRGADKEEIGDRSGRDRRSNQQEIGDRSCRERGSILQGARIDLAAPKEEQELSNSEQEREQELAAARALAASAPPVPGAPPLGSSKHELRGLVELLATGEQAQRVAQVLRLAPELVARGLQPVGRYGSEMFFGGVWARWRRSAWDLDVVIRAEAEAAQVQAANEAEAARVAEAARRQHERAQVDDLVADLEARVARPRALTTFEQLAVERNAFDRARLLAPLEALEAARWALAAGAQTRSELVAVIEGLPAAKLPTADEALQRLRQTRELAQREGRPMLALLDGGAAPPITPSPPTLTREQLVERKSRLTAAIAHAQEDGNEAAVRDLSQARLELSRQLSALDYRPLIRAHQADQETP